MKNRGHVRSTRTAFASKRDPSATVSDAPSSFGLMRTVILLISVISNISSTTYMLKQGFQRQLFLGDMLGVAPCS